MFSPNGTLTYAAGTPVVDVADPVIPDLSWFSHVTEPLFIRPPSPGDIQQGCIGDCYLLAAINAILVRPDGPVMLQGMMHDQGAGRVVFRFYKDGQATYIRVKKSYVKRPLLPLANRGAVWVRILEKAYAAFLRGGVYHHPRFNDADNKIGLSAGATHVALQHLTGQGTELSGGQADVFGLLMLLSTEYGKGTPTERALDRLRLMETISSDVFPRDGEDYPNANRWAQWNVGAKYKELQGFVEKRPTNDQFREVLQRLGADLHPVTRALVWEWASGINPGSGAIGSGIYTPMQLDLYRKVERWLATQHAVVVSTGETLPGKVTGKGHSAGEAEYSGLLADHAYTLVGVKTDERSRRFFLLRNPHGTGFFGKMRIYAETTRGKLEPQSVRNRAEAWIELTDFWQSFRDRVKGLQVSTGAPVHSPARAKLMNNLEQQLQDQKKRLNLTPPLKPRPPLG